MTGLSISVTALPSGDAACSVIRLAGEADLTCTPLRDALAAEMAGGHRLILVDLSALTFIDSGARQMIVAAYQVFRREGGTLALVRPAPAVARVLELTGVSEVIRVHGSIDEVTSDG
jgi:stage II sporulation protein AA (anti-sigma F factor antagonist)